MPAMWAVCAAWPAIRGRDTAKQTASATLDDGHEVPVEQLADLFEKEARGQECRSRGGSERISSRRLAPDAGRVGLRLGTQERALVRRGQETSLMIVTGRLTQKTQRRRRHKDNSLLSSLRALRRPVSLFACHRTNHLATFSGSTFVARSVQVVHRLGRSVDRLHPLPDPCSAVVL